MAFPELDSLILNPLDYARVVLKLGNEIELTEVDLTGILPSATIMVVTVTASGISEPAGQSMQAVAPLADWYVPAEHAVQTLWPVLDEIVPASHAVHAVLASVALNVPGEQRTHASTERAPGSA